MDIHPWVASQDEERRLRAMATYKALRGADGRADEAAVETRSGRIRLLDRLRRRELGAVRRPAKPAV